MLLMKLNESKMNNMNKKIKQSKWLDARILLDFNLSIKSSTLVQGEVGKRLLCQLKKMESKVFVVQQVSIKKI